jgi:hypothetical protein
VPVTIAAVGEAMLRVAGEVVPIARKRMYLWRAVDHERAGFRPSVLRWECAPKVRFATPRRLLRGKQVRNCIASPATEGRPLTSRRDGSLLTPRWREMDSNS